MEETKEERTLGKTQKLVLSRMKSKTEYRAGDIATGTSLESAYVAQILIKLTERGLVKRIARGLYALV